MTWASARRRTTWNPAGGMPRPGRKASLKPSFNWRSATMNTESRPRRIIPVPSRGSTKLPSRAWPKRNITSRSCTNWVAVFLPIASRLTSGISFPLRKDTPSHSRRVKILRAISRPPCVRKASAAPPPSSRSARIGHRPASPPTAKRRKPAGRGFSSRRMVT